MSRVDRLLACACALLLGATCVSASATETTDEPDRAARAETLDPAVAYLVDSFGIPVDEAQRRIDRQPSISALDEELAAAYPGEFGGIWVDQTGTGDVLVASTRPLGDLAPRARKHGLEEAVQAQTARFSLAELSAVLQDVTAGFEAANRGAAQALGAGLDVRANAVDVDEPAGSTGRQARFVRDVKAKHGERVHVGRGTGAAIGGVHDGCSHAAPVRCQPPLRGGPEIFTNFDGCTAGYVARSRVNAQMYVITAGHCMEGIRQRSFGLNWSARFPVDNTNHVIGARHNSRFNANGDMAIIRINNVTGWNPRGWVAVYTSGGTRPTTRNVRYPIRGTAAGPGQGFVLCSTGQVSATRCGGVVRTGVPVTYRDENPDRTVNNLAEVNFRSCQGDSGGPVYVNNLAYGIFVALADPVTNECSNRSYYQGIRAVQDGMNVNVVTG